MTSPTAEAIAAELAAAQAALAEARLLLREDHLAGATTRAYYAAFHAARAVLWSRGRAPKTHKGVQQLFSEELIAKDLLDKDYQVILKELYDERDLADYHASAASFDTLSVTHLVRRAERFVDAMITLLAP